MPGTLDFKYRAFLSYSHSDTAWAKWLHKRLEGFPMRGLTGRDTPLGPVPKTLRPIFRDREDFSAGHSLTEQTIANLDASAALVVLCSPASAQSHYVNEEVRLFKARHPERPVVPVIVDGKPGDPIRECFAPPLRFEVDASGTATDRPSGVLAADLREEGDGRELALAKVVAALIGVPSDEVFRRAERERKRQARNRKGVAAAIILLAIGGGYFLYSAQHRGAVLIDTAAACALYLPKDKAPSGPQDALGQCIAALQTLQKGAATDPRDAEILKLIGEGKKEEAEKLQLQVAQDDKAAGIARSKKAAERYRGIAATAGLADPKKAREYYAEAAKLDPDNTRGMLLHGDMEYFAGNLADAERVYSAVLAAVSVKGLNDLDAYWANLCLGDIYRARGDLAASMNASAKAERLLPRDYQRVGKALLAHDCGLAIRARFDTNPANAQLSYDDLVITDEFVVNGEEFDFVFTLKAYRAKLETISRLAKADPSNLAWQDDLSVAYVKVGRLFHAHGDLVGALAFYKDSFAVRDRLAKADPGNRQWQYDLALAYRHLAETGDNPEENWTKVVAILKALDGGKRRRPAITKAEVNLAAVTGDYTKAVALMKELADMVEKTDTADNGKAGAETARELGGLAWYELLARHFQAALAASERALSLAPDEVWIAGNRAHALMFLGQAEGARAAYLQHRGQRLSFFSNKTEGEAVLEDFAEFEKRGLTHPQMAEIRSLLATAR
jgi:tetratricopeptide (TPR) repeat protein